MYHVRQKGNLAIFITRNYTIFTAILLLAIYSLYSSLFTEKRCIRQVHAANIHCGA